MPLTASDFTDEEFLTSDDNDFDVVIVGAGLSGLICAYDILKREAGLDVLIIEANTDALCDTTQRDDQIGDAGGRILKDFSDCYYANLLQKHVTKLVEILNVNINKEENIDDKKRILFTKCSPSEKLPRFFGADVHHFLHLVEKRALDVRFSNYTSHEESKLLAKLSVQDFLRRNVYIPYSRTLCRAYVCSSCATRNLNNVSSLWFLVMLNGSSGFLNRLKVTMGDQHRFFIQGGMFKIIQELLKRIEHQGGKIRYQEPVKKIKFNDDRAYVQTEINCFKCEFVVVALPPPIEDIVIESPLEYSLDTRNLYAPGENVFFKIIYNSSPWLNDRHMKNIITTWDTNSELNMAYNTSYRDTKTFVISGLLAQFSSVQTHSKGLFDTLNLCFGTTVDQRYLQYKLWNPALLHEQEMISSTMSVMKPTSLTNHIHCAGVLNGRVFFASSENAVNWPGTVDGSIEVGEITAYSILSRIRPQALTAQEMFLITKKSRTKKTTSWKMFVIQYLGMVFNIAIFLSFVKAANKHS